MKQRPRLKVAFCDFWPGADIDDLFIVRTLRSIVDIELSTDPDRVIYSDFGVGHASFDCVKLHLTYENVRPNFALSDFEIGFDYDPDPRYLRFPLYVQYQNDLFSPGKLEEEMTDEDIDTIIQEKTEFCCFLISNGKCKIRNSFFEQLNKVKRVYSGGRYANNIGRSIDNKYEFIKNYKFTIAFENSAFPGYTTEKVLQPHYVKTIPIYWGNPVIDREFDMRSCVWVKGEEDFDRAIEEILKIDSDPDLHREILKRSIFYENRRSAYYSEDRMRAFLNKVLDKRTTDVAALDRKLAIARARTEAGVAKLRHRLSKVVK